MADDETTMHLELDPDSLAHSELELHLAMPDGRTLALPIPGRRFTVGDAFPLVLPEGDRWSVDLGAESVVWKRVSGRCEASFQGKAVEVCRLGPGQSLVLGGHRIWCIDARTRYLATLEGQSDPFMGRRWQLLAQNYLLGRGHSVRPNDIDLSHRSVSRAHAELVYQGGFALRCQTSGSPTVVNAQRLDEGQVQPLVHGDLIRLGEVSLRFRLQHQELSPGDTSVETQLAGYQIDGLLGRGGMAVVYAARDSQGRSVALKVPLSHLLNEPEFIRRFNREAELGASLSHPGLTRQLDYRAAGQGALPYLAMHRVQGPSLDRLALPRPVPEALDWCQQLLDTLEYLHLQGVVHRDIKPANLFLEEGRLCLGDFGIAHFDGATSATATGTFLGTPAYLDPAYLRGQSCDARSDLYSVGLLLYEWLSGTLPFSPDPTQVLAQKLTQPLPSILGRCPQLDPALVQFLELLLADQPAQRFQSASEAGHALRELRGTATPG